MIHVSTELVLRICIAAWWAHSNCSQHMLMLFYYKIVLLDIICLFPHMHYLRLVDRVMENKKIIFLVRRNKEDEIGGGYRGLNHSKKQSYVRLLQKSNSN